MDVDHMDTPGHNGSANADMHIEEAATHHHQAQQQQPIPGGNTATNYAHRLGKHPAALGRTGPVGTSSGATSPERRAQSVPIDPSRIKIRQYSNRFQPLAEHNSAQPDADNDRVREGSISDASSSRGSRRREPIPLTTQIL